MKQFYVYLHCKPNGDVFYVGKGSGKRSHKLIAGRKNPHHTSIVRKYGISNIEILVFNRKSEQDAFDTEIQWIAVLRAAGFMLVNGTDGGEGISGLKHSELAKRNIGAAASVNQIGNTNGAGPHRKGYVPSFQTRMKLSAAAKKQWQDPLKMPRRNTH